MTIESLQAHLAMLDQPALYELDNFAGRAAVLDMIASEIIDPIDDLQVAASPRVVRALHQAAEQLQHRLYAVDEALFHDLRDRIRAGCRAAPLWQQIEQLIGSPIAGDPERAVVGYDHLDRLVTGILDDDTLPEPTLDLDPEMVLYQRTPARIIFALSRRANLGPQECFYDLGAGLGHVPTLVHLLSGTTARGVEIEPAFCAYAQARAATLGLANVTFLPADARHVDYAQGTFFYMYTPFEGAMLLEMLAQLRERAQRGPIRLATYGPCTAIVAQQDWLSAPRPAEPGTYRLAIFRSHSH